jgi:hypothetical protein
VPESRTGSQSFADEMDSLIAPRPALSKPAEPKAESKPESKPKDEAPAKPESIQPVKEKDPVSLRKRLAEIEAEYKGYKLTAAQEREKLDRKISEFEKRKYLTPEQEQQFSAAERRASELEAELSARDFRESKDFKDNFKSKWDRVYQDAIEEVAGLQVETPDGMRQATQSDFNTVLTAPKNQYWTLAKQMFGEAAQVVISRRNSIKDIEAQAAEAADRHKQTYEQTKQQKIAQSQREAQEFQTLAHEVDGQLEAKHPDIFGRDAADEEGSQALQKGLEFVDTTLASLDKLTLQERAGRTALIRRMAGALPRVVIVNRRLAGELEEAKKTIAQLQGTDPGAGGESPAAAEPKKSSGGVDELVKEFDLQ